MLRDFTARIRPLAIGLAVAAAIGVTPLSACGVKGPLKLPPPSPAAGAPSSAPPPASMAAPAAEPPPQPPERKP